MTKAKLWGALALLILVIVLVLQNTESVDTRFLFFTFTLPRATLLAVTMLIGIAVGMLISMALAARRASAETGEITRRPITYRSDDSPE